MGHFIDAHVAVVKLINLGDKTQAICNKDVILRNVILEDLNSDEINPMPNDLVGRNVLDTTVVVKEHDLLEKVKI